MNMVNELIFSCLTPFLDSADSTGDNEKGETTDYTDYADFFLTLCPLCHNLLISCSYSKK